MSKVEWGQATWCLAHTLAYKLHPAEERHAPRLWEELARVCGHLPCPDCRAHAADYLRARRRRPPASRAAVNDFFWRMHNAVNRRLGKPIFAAEDCAGLYARARTHRVVQHFAIVMSQTARNDRAMLDALARQRAIASFLKYYVANRQRFVP